MHEQTDSEHLNVGGIRTRDKQRNAHIHYFFAKKKVIDQCFHELQKNEKQLRLYSQLVM